MRLTNETNITVKMMNLDPAKLNTTLFLIKLTYVSQIVLDCATLNDGNSILALRHLLQGMFF